MRRDSTVFKCCQTDFQQFYFIFHETNDDLSSTTIVMCVFSGRMEREKERERQSVDGWM